MAASSPAEMVAACDITFAMLADPEAALEVRGAAGGSSVGHVEGLLACSELHAQAARHSCVFACVHPVPAAARPAIRRCSLPACLPCCCQAALGPGGAVEGISAGKGYVDMSTVDEATSQQIGAAVVARGGRFLEVRQGLAAGGGWAGWRKGRGAKALQASCVVAARSGAPLPPLLSLPQAPVSGSKKPAIDGQLIILAAGDEGLFRECEAAFGAMVSACCCCGPGSGVALQVVALVPADAAAAAARLLSAASLRVSSRVRASAACSWATLVLARA